MRILDREYPLKYTIAAQSKIASKAGGLKNIESLFNCEDETEIFKNAAFMAAEMIEGYINSEKIKCRILGQEYTGPEPISAADLCGILDVADTENMVREITAAMRAGNKSNVEVKPDKKKEPLSADNA